MPSIGDSRVSAGTGEMKFSATRSSTPAVDVVNTAKVVSESILATKVADMAAEITLLTAKLNGVIKEAAELKVRLDTLEAQ